MQNIEPCFWIFYVIGQIYIVRKGRVLKIIYVSGHTGQMLVVYPKLPNCQLAEWRWAKWRATIEASSLSLSPSLSFTLQVFCFLETLQSQIWLHPRWCRHKGSEWGHYLPTYVVTLWIVLHLVFLNYKMMSLKLSPFEKYQIEIIIKITWAVVRLSW